MTGLTSYEMVPSSHALFCVGKKFCFAGRKVCKQSKQRKQRGDGGRWDGEGAIEGIQLW